MNGNSVLDITGVAAWVGGIATALAALSCDVAPCEPDDADDCPLVEPVDSEDLDLDDPEVDALVDSTEPDAARPYECDRSAHPSVYVMPSLRYHDYFVPVDVDAMWYEHDGRTYEARCLQGEEGCVAWIAGYELAGDITVSAEHCETVVSETVEVESLPGSCHVRTEYLILEMSTRGCLTAASQDPPDLPPVPGWPMGLTSVDASEHPGDRDPGHPGWGRPDELIHPPGPPPPPTHGLASPG